MRGSQVGDVDVVAHAGPVGGVVVVAEDGDGLAPAGDDLAGDLDEVGGDRAELAAASLRVGARDIEVAQRDIAQVAGERQVAQHPQIGRASGRERVGPSGSISVVAGTLKKKKKIQVQRIQKAQKRQQK